MPNASYLAKLEGRAQWPKILALLKIIWLYFDPKLPLKSVQMQSIKKSLKITQSITPKIAAKNCHKNRPKMTQNRSKYWAKVKKFTYVTLKQVATNIGTR